MPAAAAAQEFLTSGAAARHLGIPEWWIARLYRTGALPEPPRVGRMRVIAEADLPAIRQALVEGGWLKDGARRSGR